jgi:murein DD-endopeptidase MepM/ murein hydrolase activator NlpD
MKKTVSPILGATYPFEIWQKIDLERPFLQMKQEELPVPYLYRILQEIQKISGPVPLWGGYLERRIYYGQSRHFNNEVETRDRHLGIDIWMPAGTSIYAPVAGKVHSFQYNAQDLDYGGTILIELEDGSVLLFGHLSKSSLDNIASCTKVKPGQLIGWLGDENENGGWPSHLHLQHILDLEGWVGDYPGVVNKHKVEQYARNCPNPEPFIKGSLFKPGQLDTRPVVLV